MIQKRSYQLNRNDNEVPWSLCNKLFKWYKLIKGYLQSHITLNHQFFPRKIVFIFAYPECSSKPKAQLFQEKALLVTDSLKKNCRGLC